MNVSLKPRLTIHARHGARSPKPGILTPNTILLILAVAFATSHETRNLFLTGRAGLLFCWNCTHFLKSISGFPKAFIKCRPLRKAA